MILFRFNIDLAYVFRVLLSVPQYEDREVSGIVGYVDPYLDRVKIEFENGHEWIELGEIVSATAK